MQHYHNENDPYVAQWLRNLIAAGHLAPGFVDERDIRDVEPDDLDGFTQCHFFAGIGGWSYALRLAGWPDNRPVWTGSCPCQPFSHAGRRKGHADERHLWPAWARLIRERRPVVVFGEQVAGPDGLAWLDVVCSELEDIDYTVAAVDFPAAGVNAPHIRPRVFFMADTDRGRLARLGRRGQETRTPERREVRHLGVADADLDGHRPGTGDGRIAALAWGEDGDDADRRGDVGDAGSAGLSARESNVIEGPWRAHEGRAALQSGAARNPWADVEWLACSDGKARPTQPGLFPLAHGVPGRVGRLRAYGNAVVPQAAAAVIAAYMEVAP